MADALISPAVGAGMWAATTATTAYAAKKLRGAEDPSLVPLMGVTGAFVFAAQMLNFSIPGTGSSGHLSGGLILAVLLGPEAAFLVMASILTVQALFLADGGLLSLGANIFNLGFLPAFFVCPLVFRKIAGGSPTRRRILAASLAGGVIGLQLGAFGVVLETVVSGVSRLPFSAFLLLVQPIHLAIGIAEGLITAAVVLFVRQARPELLSVGGRGDAGGKGVRRVVIGLAIAAVVAGGVLSQFASDQKDGLEWSIDRVTGGAGVESTDPVRAALGALQQRTAILPDYGFRPGDSGETPPPEAAGTSTSGLVGAAMVLAISTGIGLLLRRRSASRGSRSGSSI